MRVCGIDITRRSPRSRKGARYAYVIYDDREGMIASGKDVPFHEIVASCKRSHTTIIATDNIQEIARDMPRVRNALENEDFVLIKANVGARLPDLAQKYGLASGGKLSPMEAAKVCALLALKGIGQRVKLFADECKIEVTRKHSRGDREIAHIRNVIAERLTKNGINYILEERRTPHGLSRAMFLVEERVSKIRELLGDIKTVNSSLIISPIAMEGGEEHQKNRPIMVGIDPGMTVGLAIINMNGEIILLKSMRTVGVSVIVDEIKGYGLPVLIATDVPHEPSLVTRLARTFGARVFTTHKVYTGMEKREFVSGIDVKNSHERDALFAVLKAYNSFKAKFAQLESLAKKLGLTVTDEMKAGIIRGSTIKDILVDTIAELINQKSQDRIIIRVHDTMYEEKLREKVAELEQKIKILEQKILTLKDEKKLLERKYSMLRDSTRKEIKRDEAIAMRETIIRELRAAVREARESALEARGVLRIARLVNLLHQKGYIVIYETSGTPKAIKELDSKYGLGPRDGILIRSVKDRSFIATARKHEIKVIIVEHPEILDEDPDSVPPVISADRLKLKNHGPVWVITDSMLKKAKDELTQEIKLRNADIKELLMFYKRKREKDLIKMSGNNEAGEGI